MAANTVTCTNATVAAVTTDTVFSITKTIQNPTNGVILYFTLDINTAAKLTITAAVRDESINTTDDYKVLTGTGSSVVALSYEFSADGNWRLPLQMYQNETTVVFTLTYTTTGGSGACACKVMEY